MAGTARSLHWLALAAAALFAAAAGAAPLGYDDARHLLARTGFGATDAQVREFARLQRAEAVERLLAGVRDTPVTAPPEFARRYQRPPLRRELSEAEKKALFAELVRQGAELRGWWLGEMLSTDSPLTERMVLFWHNHFVSSQQKVKSAQLMYRQNALFRRHALGSFAALLREVARDPAMLVYLDGARNFDDQPNENFARELMELFTLGEGHYAERDVKEAARAFTGWSVDPSSGEFRFLRLRHDAGIKTVLGHTGRLDGDQVLGILLARPETARTIATKLWREFVSPRPDPAGVEGIAAVLRDSGYDLRATLRALLLAPAFWAAENRGSLVKSPVDLVVGTVRSLGVQVPDALPLALLAGQLGQALFAPPNVRGWPGGEAWIDAGTLLARRQFLDRLLRDDASRRRDLALLETAPPREGDAPQRAAMRGRILAGPRELRFDPAAWQKGLADASPAALTRLTLALPPAEPLPEGLAGVDLLRWLTQDAAYQLR